jgi:hypothetical protein
VTSGNDIGLQRGFSFAVVVEQGSRLRYWKPKVQCFIWKLMTDPTGVPKTGEKYILDLGDVWKRSEQDDHVSCFRQVARCLLAY